MPKIIKDLMDYNPLPKQLEFHNSTAKYKAFIGGFGSGKTMALVQEVLKLAIRYNNNRILVGRETYPALEATTKLDFLDICPEAIIRTRNDTKNYIELFNGSVIFFRGLDKPNKFKSLNLGVFAIDEASEVSEDMFFMLQSRLRYMKVGARYGLLATNYEGHNWIWRNFVNKQEEKERKEKMGIKYDPNLYAYFESPTTDNTYLPPDYVNSLLQSFSDNWIRRYVYGSFEEFEGLVFYAFDPSKNVYEKHSIDQDDNDADVNFVNDRGRFIIAIDPGVRVTAVMFSFYRYKDKKLFVFAELYKNRMSIKEISALIKEVLTKYKITNPYYYIDPSSVRYEQTSQTSIIKDFRKEGINCRTANNDINFGILRVNEMLKDKRLMFYKKLTNTFNEITDYYIDEESGKPKKNQADHLMDVLRYITTTLTASEVSNVSKEQEIAEIRKRRKGLRLGRKKSVKNMYNYLTIRK